jgi:hypothetical protein
MRVDPVILRRMLEEVEEVPEPELPAMPACAKSETVSAYHLRLLVAGGYLAAQSQCGDEPRELSLTLAGQQLLDDLRSAPPVARVLGESMARVATSLLIATLLAKARAAGFGL